MPNWTPPLVAEDDQLAREPFLPTVINITPTSRTWVSDVAALVGALAWPFLAGAVVVLLALTRRGRLVTSQLAGQIGRVDAFGLLSLEFTAEGSRRVKAGIETIFREYRRDEEREFHKLIDEHELERKLESLVEQYVAPSLTATAKGNYRCTIYVQDLIFKDGLYQLLDYYPHGGGAGRVMPNRFGQIGRAFRAGRPATDGHLTENADRLVAEYGMTKAEVGSNAVGRRSLSCVTLERDGEIVGGIYIDAEEPGAFGDDEAAFEIKVAEGASQLDITSALADITSHVLRTGLHLDIMRRPG